MDYEIKKSTRKYKKYMAVFKDKTIHFGDNRYQQYKDQTKLKLYEHLDHLDKKRRELYYKRHGTEAKLYSAKWFSHKYLW
jgi:hypothetical protein